LVRPVTVVAVAVVTPSLNVVHVAAATVLYCTA